jgi:hypothetical protein
MRSSSAPRTQQKASLKRCVVDSRKIPKWSTIQRFYGVKKFTIVH